MFCNQRTDQLGPHCLTNKAATRVKKTTKFMTGSPEQIIIEDADEVDVPEGSKDLHQTKSCVSGGAVMSSNLPKKKQPWVIELSSNSTSIKIKEELDSCTNSVELKHDQAITSCKHKLKTIFPS